MKANQSFFVDKPMFVSRSRCIAIQSRWLLPLLENVLKNYLEAINKDNLKFLDSSKSFSLFSNHFFAIFIRHQNFRSNIPISPDPLLSFDGGEYSCFDGMLLYIRLALYPTGECEEGRLWVDSGGNDVLLGLRGIGRKGGILLEVFKSSIEW